MTKKMVSHGGTIFPLVAVSMRDMVCNEAGVRRFRGRGTRIKPWRVYDDSISSATL